MRFGKAFVLSCLISVMAVGAAGAVTFNFSFTNSADGGGLVSGHVLVRDNATDRAVSVRVTSAPFGVGEYASLVDSLPNSFTVADGVLTTFSFFSFGKFNKPPFEADCCTFGFDGSVGGVITAALWNSPDPDNITLVNAPDFTWTRVVEGPAPVAPVPLPAPLLMLLVALGGLGLAGRSRPAGP